MSHHGIDHHVGKTPLLRLNKLSDLTGCEILAKAEFMNPGGSVKDRAALGIIKDAEQKGLLRPGQISSKALPETPGSASPPWATRAATAR